MVAGAFVGAASEQDGVAGVADVRDLVGQGGDGVRGERAVVGGVRRMDAEGVVALRCGMEAGVGRDPCRELAQLPHRGEQAPAESPRVGGAVDELHGGVKLACDQLVQIAAADVVVHESQLLHATLDLAYEVLAGATAGAGLRDLRRLGDEPLVHQVRHVGCGERCVAMLDGVEERLGIRRCPRVGQG